MMKNYQSIFLTCLVSVLLYACAESEGTQVEENDFISIFNGENLDGWAGDSVYWSVQDGDIVGEITPETLLESNSFLTWEGGQLGDFELKAEFKITESGNSGINYRSEVFPGVPNALKGYQADIDGKNRYTGQNYEERGRTTLAYRGQVSTILEQADGWSKDSLRSKVQNNAWTDLTVDASLGEAEELLAKINSEDWNSIHLIIKGNRLQHYINGTLMSDVTDLDEINGKASGLLGVQVHVGPPMQVRYRNLQLLTL